MTTVFKTASRRPLPKLVSCDGTKLVQVKGCGPAGSTGLSNLTCEHVVRLTPDNLTYHFVVTEHSNGIACFCRGYMFLEIYHAGDYYSDPCPAEPQTDEACSAVYTFQPAHPCLAQPVIIPSHWTWPVYGWVDPCGTSLAADGASLWYDEVRGPCNVPATKPRLDVIAYDIDHTYALPPLDGRCIDIWFITYCCPGPSYGIIGQSPATLSLPMLTAVEVLQVEATLREVFPQKHLVLQAIDIYKQQRDTKGCKGCKLHSFESAILSAVYSSSPEDQEKIKHIVENG